MVLTGKNLEWWCERGILCLMLGMLVFAPLAFGAVDAWAYLTLQGAGALVVVLWVVRLWVNRKTKILWPPLAWVVLAFVLYALARYFTADIEYVARKELALVLLFALVFVVAVNTLRGQEETDAVSYTLIGLGTLVACYACGQAIMHSDKVWNQHSGMPLRGSGTYISANHFAGMVEMILPLALVYLLVGKVKIVPRILLAYAVVALGLGLTASFSRAGWVAGAAGILFVLAVLLGHKNHRRNAAILLAVLAVGGGFFVTHFLAKTQGFTHRIVKQDATAQNLYDWGSRLKMWGAAERMWLDHFWLGVGPAHYDYRFREYRPEDLQSQPDRCHNDYLNLLTDWGVVGGVIVFAGLGVFIFGLVKTWPHTRREENDFGSGRSNRFAFFLGATGGLVSLAVHSTMDFNLHIPANALIAVTLLGLLASNVRFATEQYWFRPVVPVKVGISVAFGAAVVFFFAQEWRQGRETWWLAQAEKAEPFTQERAARLQRAFAAEPKNFQTAYDLGECYRTESFEGGKNFRPLAQSAMDWYARAMPLNPHDGYNFMRTGMCLDWLGDHAASEKFYSEAELRDPNGLYFVANLGWHYVQTGDYPAARQCYIRSLNLGGSNATARNYLYYICEPKLVERASGRPILPDIY